MSIQEMIALLERQKELQERMLALSYEKRKALLDNDVDGLNELVQREMKHLAELNKLEKQRMTLLYQIAEEHGMISDEITVSRLCQLAEGEEKSRLTALAESLSRMLEEHTALNARNRELLEVHIDYTETILNLALTPNNSLSHIYGAGGSTNEEEAKGPGLFDTQI